MNRYLLLGALACALLSPTAARAAAPDPPAEVTSRDWAYQAIEELAGRGLVHGYKDAAFLGGRKLTRFEMASLVKRVIDSLLEIPVPEDGKPIIPETPSTAASRGLGYEPPPLGRKIQSGNLSRTASFTETDLATVKRLSDEYSVELAVIGVNLQETMDRLAALEGRVEAIEKNLRDPKGPLQTLINSVARLDKIRISGYLQARYESFGETREADPAGPRQPIQSRFTTRRVRLVFTTRPTQHLSTRVQVDAGPGQVETRDMWIDYFMTGNPATGHTATIGQFKVPFGFEVIQSSGVREAPERGRIARFFFPTERDRGAKLSSSTGQKVVYEVGVFNGTQPGRTGLNNNDNNNNKNFAGRVRTTLFKRLDIAAQVSFGKTSRTALAAGEKPRESGTASAAKPYENNQYVYGLDFQYHAPWVPLELRGEWMWGKANGANAHGYILQAIYTASPRWQAVVKYDWFGLDDITVAPVGAGGTPVGDSVAYTGSLSNLSLGAIYHLDRSTRIKLFYEIHGRGRDRIPKVEGNAGVVPWQGNILRFEVITNF